MSIMSLEKSKKSDFLLEIGCEEIPPLYTKEAVLQLERIANKIFSDARLTVEKVSSFGTYRRIGILARGLGNKQNPQREEISGPPKSIAYDANGEPTKTFHGFLKKTEVTPKDILIKKTDKGEYLYAVKEKPSLETVEILPSLCREIIKLIQFPKTMRWTDSFSFARPIRWMAALFGAKQIKFEIAGVVSGNYTFGHRLLCDKKIKISNAADYAKLMKKHKVLIYPEARRNIVMEQLKRAALEAGAKPEFEPNLLEEIIYLTEWPSAFRGNFGKKYLKLPAEVLLASMSKNQKTFTLFGEDAKAMPNFAAVIDNSISNIEEIKRNYENVLEAKLKDAEFFYNQDLKIKLEDRNKELEKVIFHKDIGNMLEKVERLKQLSDYVSQQLNLSEKDRELVGRCAWLSKADLPTAMVKEFPSLQGTMGFYYAKENGEPSQAAIGIKEHYLPKFSLDVLPQTRCGSVVGFVDKLDTIISCFAINLIPTGSYDPYALRRHGQGAVRIALSAKFNLNISDFISLNIKLIDKKIRKEPEVLKQEIISFLKERLKPFLLEEAKREDLADAVLNSSFDNFVNITEKTRQLSVILGSKDLFDAHKVVERTAHILKSVKQVLPQPNPHLFKENLEKELFDIYQNKKDEILGLISQKKYALATKVYGNAFFDIVHIFFEKVIVNADNAAIKQNRLSLMNAINKLYTEGIADISFIKLNQTVV